VNVDAEKMLLCTKKDNNTNKQLLFQYYHAPLYLDRYEAVSQISGSYDANTPEARLMFDALNDSFWNIRATSVKNVATLAKADKARVQPKLISLSQQDEKPQVRAAALKALAKQYPADSLMTVYEKGMTDSSYLVMTTAFKIICELDEAKGLALAKKLEQENDINVDGTLAVFYAQKGNAANNAFLLNTLTKLRGYERYELISSYPKYLVRIDDESVMRAGISKLADIGRSAASRYTRNGAVSALSELVIEFDIQVSKGADHLNEMKTAHASPSELILEENKIEKIKRSRKELKDLVDDIKKNEKDPRLRKSYFRN